MAAINSSYLTDAVVGLLASYLPVPVGDNKAPDSTGEDALTDRLVSGYCIVRRIPSGPRFTGSEIGGQPDSMQMVRYQITGHGTLRRQAERIADLAAAVLVDRSDDRGDRSYVYPLEVAGHVVLSRNRAGEIPTDSLGSTQAGVLVDIHLSVA